MSRAAGRLAVLCTATLLAAGCAHTIPGTATRAAPGIDDESHSPIDVESVMLDQGQMRAITGAGDNLTIVPSMDGKIPVDASDLMNGTPHECQWYFAETQTFGPEVEEFHKTTHIATPRPRDTRSPIWSDRYMTAAQPNSDRRSSASGPPTPTRYGCARRAHAAVTTESRTSCSPRCRSVRSPIRFPTSS
jgi:hypothetical protein